MLNTFPTLGENMAANAKVRIAVVGLGFGWRFSAIYQAHPEVEYVGIFDTDQARTAWVAQERGISRVHASLEEILASPDYNAVHLVTPLYTHYALAKQVLQAGKHCACAVPMGLSLPELEEIIELQEKTKLNYMMMETMVYRSDYLYAKQLFQNEAAGKIQFLRGCQSMDHEPYPAWHGLPPLWYPTHAVSPLLDILDTQATETHCYGSGEMREEFKQKYGNPYPIETALFKLKGTNAKAEAIVTLTDTAPHGAYLVVRRLYSEVSFET